MKKVTFVFIALIMFLSIINSASAQSQSYTLSDGCFTPANSPEYLKALDYEKSYDNDINTFANYGSNWPYQALCINPTIPANQTYSIMITAESTTSSSTFRAFNTYNGTTNQNAQGNVVFTNTKETKVITFPIHSLTNGILVDGANLKVYNIKIIDGVPVAPSIPLNLIASAGNSQVTVTWTAVTGAAGYNIKRSTTAGGPYTTIATNVYGSPYTDTTVTNGTTYYYVVTALNDFGESGNSNEASATPTSSNSEVDQNIKEFSIPMNSFCSVSQSMDLSLNITNLKSSVADLKLFLYKKNGASLSTAGSSYDGIESTIVPATSFQLAGNETSLYHITFGGSNNNCADRVYSGKIEVDSESYSLIASGWVDGTKGNATVIINGGQAWKQGETSGSPENPGNPGNLDTTAPAAVTNLTTGTPTSSSINLSWTAPGNDGSVGTATYYDIRYSTSQINEANWTTASQVTGEPAPTVAGTSQSMIINSLNANTTYYFALKTRDQANNISSMSNVVNGTTTQPTYSQNVIPTMTSNTSPSGVASSSGVWSGHEAYMAFDKSNDTYWYSASGHPHWIAYDFGSEKIINKYTLTAFTLAGNEPNSLKSWTFEGTNDGIKWTTLDTQTNQPGWGSHELRSYTFTNTTAFKKYRVYITASQGGTWAALEGIEMMQVQ
ncbi:fibronectin type III domain-containing protein [Paenibacillus sp. FSL H8-0034]|uniref:fibronectin type III domain-containing protein n=1 Tax=Paenibacillus sp. FSL H8-0034 TaxID=2954671 RepID=UPI0030F57B27